MRQNRNLINCFPSRISYHHSWAPWNMHPITCQRGDTLHIKLTNQPSSKLLIYTWATRFPRGCLPWHSSWMKHHRLDEAYNAWYHECLSINRFLSLINTISLLLYVIAWHLIDVKSLSNSNDILFTGVYISLILKYGDKTLRNICKFYTYLQQWLHKYQWRLNKDYFDFTNDVIPTFNHHFEPHLPGNEGKLSTKDIHMGDGIKMDNPSQAWHICQSKASN